MYSLVLLNCGHLFCFVYSAQSFGFPPTKEMRIKCLSEQGSMVQCLLLLQVRSRLEIKVTSRLSEGTTLHFFTLLAYAFNGILWEQKMYNISQLNCGYLFCFVYSTQYFRFPPTKEMWIKYLSEQGSMVQCLLLLQVRSRLEIKDISRLSEGTTLHFSLS